MQDSKTSNVRLRVVTEADIPVFFEQQLDASANFMAAFTAKDPTDKTAFTARWTRILAETAIQKQTILFHEEVAGHISSFEQFGLPSVSYWIGKEYWGKGVATSALYAFLGQIKTRPLYARAAKDNVASIRVLQKCGFQISSEDSGFSDSRGEVVEEFILIFNES